MKSLIFLLIILGLSSSYAQEAICTAPTRCPNPRPAAGSCSTEQKPVVAVAADKSGWGIYDNGCQACMGDGISKYYELDQCEDIEWRAVMCPMTYEPVCGFSTERRGTGMDVYGRDFWKKYSNRCIYCVQMGKEGLSIPGRCPKVLTATDHVFMS